MQCIPFIIVFFRIILSFSCLSIDLKVQKNWVLGSESLTLSCTIQNSTKDLLEISWLEIVDNDDVEVHTHSSVAGNETLITWKLDPPFEKSNYSFVCSSADITSNTVTVYFRDLAISKDSDVILEGQLVTVKITHYGDENELKCNVEEQITAITPTMSRLSFKAQSSFELVCNTTYLSDGYMLNSSLPILVLAPEWGEWSEFTSCGMDQISAECLKSRTRSCKNESKFSSCSGDSVETDSCHPDECEPNMSEWGGWSLCEYNIDTICTHKRHRECQRAYNSTRDCQDNLIEEATCDDIKCDRWDDWSAWSSCHKESLSRDRCVKDRQRQCALHGVLCAGANTDVAECDRSTCAPIFNGFGRVSVKSGYNRPFSLACDIKPSTTSGFDGMFISWKRDEFLVKNPALISSQSLHFSDTGLTEDSRGVYSCCVENQFGYRCNDGWHVELADYGPVAVGTVDQIIPLVVPHKTNYTLVCQFDGFQLTYKWYRGEQVEENLIIGEESRWLQLVKMSKSQSGRYSCCAHDYIKSGKSQCSVGYTISMPENVQRKYLIITICVILILILVLILYIACAHTNKMNGFKRRLRCVFTSGHVKLYNGSDPYGTGPSIQRSHSYIKRLSRSHPLSKSELAAVVTKIASSLDQNSECNDSDLATEFDSVPNNSITISRTPVGTESKNRYLNVLPNGHSRVILPEIGKDPTSVYINANYVRGYKLVPKEYIATQGPLPSTAHDFWRMVWNEGCRIIVMTTGIIENNRMKCCLYWPASEEKSDVCSEFGSFRVSQKEMYPGKFFTISILELGNTFEENEESRLIYHIWYHSWPDFGVPEDTAPFLDFVEYVRAFKSALSPSPVLVHCSAGIGRTGTFISVNLGIEQYQDIGKVDPLSYICQLRQDRGGMVQTLDQYCFVYRALLAYHIRNKDNKSGVACGPPTLFPDNVMLPSNLQLPVLADPESSRVAEGFISNLTQTLPCVSRYSDSVVSGVSENDETGEETPVTNRPPSDSKPLLEKKESRKSKVKSLFFSPPSLTKSREVLDRRSLSLNNMDQNFSPRVSISSSTRCLSVQNTADQLCVTIATTGEENGVAMGEGGLENDGTIESGAVEHSSSEV